MTENDGNMRCMSIDYHERNNWAIIWVLLTQKNEAFVYREFNPSPLKVTTTEICDSIADMCKGDIIKFCLIDPLANKNQTNTGTSALFDMNKRFRTLYAQGAGPRIFITPYDTRGTHGRDEIRNRLHNSMTCKRPSNNTVTVNGVSVDLPTLWVSRECPMTATSLRNWRYEEWTGNTASAKDRKESPIQKYSHFCTALEGIMKDTRFRTQRGRMTYIPPSTFKRGR